jgi:AMP-binding enzyme
MILSDSALAGTVPAPEATGSIRVTIDKAFCRLVERHPDALALVDAANRESFTDGQPRRLTYAEADRAVAAIAGRLRRMGLPTDAIIGIQLPNMVENILVVLGVLRAGMIAAPLPLLWRRADAVTALARIGAKAIITCGRIRAFNQAQFGMYLAAEVFSIRYVCAFGDNPPDGVVPFDDLLAAETLDPIPPLDRELQHDAASHVAAVTFDVGEGGLVPVARNHSELLAGSLAVVLESGLAQNTNILSALAPSSFAGISLTLLPWLLIGGALVLHHPFDPGTLAVQRWDHGCSALVLPAAVAFSLAETEAFADQEPVSVIAAWRSPERLAASAPWREPRAELIDVAIFGETALIPARRARDGAPGAIPFGPIAIPRDGPDGIAVAELVRTEAGTLAVRGPLVPRVPFLPGSARADLPYFKVGRDGLVDTGYPCRVDSVTGAMVVTGAPAGIVSVGGYRFPLRLLRDAAGRIEAGATLTSLPDPLLGQRLIGNAADRVAMQAALGAVGVNPIVISAFADRSGSDAAEAAL